MNKKLAAAVKAAHDLPTTPADALSVRETDEHGRRWLILTIGKGRVEVTAGDNEGYGVWVESSRDAAGNWAAFNTSTFPLDQARDLLTDFATFAAQRALTEQLSS